MKVDARGEMKECGKVFNLSDPETRGQLNAILLKASADDEATRQAVVNFFNLADIMVNAPEETHRTHPVCPRCHFKGVNPEGLRNATNANPLRTHPQHYQCTECGFEFCTDCKMETGEGSEHHMRICRGYRCDDLTSRYQTCPACEVMTERIDGCAFILCKNPHCGRKWCWACRCLRWEEQQTEHHDRTKYHYCITQGRWMSNPAWVEIAVNDETWKPYEETAPAGFEFVPA